MRQGEEGAAMAGTLEIIAQDHNRCGEAPIWDAARRRLIWTDIESSLTYQFSPDTGDRRVLSQGLSAAGIALNRSGELIFAGAEGLHLWREPGDYRTLVSEHQGERLYF